MQEQVNFSQDLVFKTPLLCFNRTQLRTHGRIQLWRSFTCSVKKVAAITSGFLRSLCPSDDLELNSSLSRCFKPWGILDSSFEARMLMFPHPWMLLRRLNRPGSARQARVALAVLRRSSSRPCQDDPHSLCERGQVCHESDTMALILCADEVWRGRRSEFCLCFTEQISQALDTQRTRRCVEATFLKMDFNTSDVFKNVIAAQYNVPYCRQCAFHFPELSYSLKVSLYKY